MPYVVSGLVAAGALAAALSTADGLLLTITGALSHDVYYRIFRPQASTQFRLVISKSLLLVVAVLAAIVAAERPGTILLMVAWAFSIAASVEFDSIPWLAMSGIRMAPWFHVQSTSAGVFGVASGFITVLLVSIFTAPPGNETKDFLERIRRTPGRDQS